MATGGRRRREVREALLGVLVAACFGAAGYGLAVAPVRHSPGLDGLARDLAAMVRPPPKERPSCVLTEPEVAPLLAGS